MASEPEIGRNDASTGHALPRVLEWTCNPWTLNPRRMVITMLATAALLALIQRLLGLGGSPAQGLASIAIAIGAMELLVPTYQVIRCRIDEHGIARRVFFVWERHAWDRVGHARIDAHGLWVYRSSRWFDVARGAWLPYHHLPEPERVRLIAALRQRLGARDLQR